MKTIYLYTNSKDRITNARLQRPAKIGEICRIYVDDQYMTTAQACKVPRPGNPCAHCCMLDIVVFRILVLYLLNILKRMLSI